MLISYAFSGTLIKKQAPVSVYDVLPEVLYGGLR